MATNGAYGGMLGWSVGRFDWLNNPDSKVNRYWRAIEQGSNYWVGKNIVGLWGPDAGTNTRPNRLINGGPLAPMDRGAGGDKFVPFFSEAGGDMEGAKRRALWYFFGGGTRNMNLLQPKNAVTKKGNAKSGPLSPSDQRRMLFYLMNFAPHVPFVSGVVGQPILAQHFYTDALTSFGNPAQREIAMLQRQLTWAIGNSPITSAAGRNKARQAMADDSRHGIVKTKALPPAVKPNFTGTPVHGYLADNQRGLAEVSATVYTQDFIHDGRGFSNGQWQAMVRDINAQMAREFQREVVAHMSRKRTPRPATNDLIEATENERNIYPS
jgi:hypothetical protein